MGDEVKKSVIDELGEMKVNEFMYTVAEAGKIHGEKMGKVIADTVAADIQGHLDALGYKPRCPKCGSVQASKNGKRGNIQRYKCARCGASFSSTSGTILEKTAFSWDVWITLIFCMLNGRSIADTKQILADDLKCFVEDMTLWMMRLKVMNAVGHVRREGLRGVVQMDDMFVREGQKHALKLEDPLPKDISPGREPRYGRVASQLGIRGSEFANITCAVDASGRCAIECLGMGSVGVDAMKSFIRRRTRDVAFACTDADNTYISACAEIGLPHYVRPSDYLTIIKNAGYETPSKVDEKKARKQRERNDRILETLWEEGMIDYIANRGRMTYSEFKSAKRKNRLSLSRVNELHKDLRNYVERNTAGVSTKYLRFYLAWFEYTRNAKASHGKKLKSKKDAERVLLDAIGTRENLTGADIREIRSNPLEIASPSGKYLHQLEAKTEQAREITGDAEFMFGDEDGIENFDVRATLRSLPTGELKKLAKACAVHGWGKRNRTMLIEGLCKVDGIGDIMLANTALKDRERKAQADVLAKGKKAARPPHRNRQVVKGTFPQVSFCRKVADAAEPVVFLDCETTGVNKHYDEVLSVAIVGTGGEVLYDGMFKPQHRRKWTQAEAVNGISPDDVEGCPTLMKEKRGLEKVISDAGCIVGWNIRFDVEMLYAGGIAMPKKDCSYLDLEKVFCEWWNKGKPQQQRLKRCTLENAVELLGLDDGGRKKHTALGDAGVLVGVWEAIKGE